jgi:hypothetical protein
VRISADFIRRTNVQAFVPSSARRGRRDESNKWNATLRIRRDGGGHTHAIKAFDLTSPVALGTKVALHFLEQRNTPSLAKEGIKTPSAMLPSS